MSAMHFETERLAMVPWQADQLADVLTLHSDPDTVRYLGPTGLPWTLPQAEAALASWMQLYAEHSMGKLRLVRKSDGALIGRSGFAFFPSTGEPELGYLLLPDYRGQGYAKEAAAGWRDWFFAHTPRSHFIGMADIRNDPSNAILRAIGMQRTHIADAFGLTCHFHIMKRMDRPA